MDLKPNDRRPVNTMAVESTGPHAIHAVSMAVWDIPSPVEEGLIAGVKVGAKCKEGCSLAGSPVEILDPEGRRAGSGYLGDRPAERTSALYWARVEFGVPRTVGHSRWVARFPKVEGVAPHGEASFPFGVMITAGASCLFAVTVVDEATKSPLANAYVRVGARTQFTDGEGKSLVHVSSGPQELVAWKRDHKMFRTKVDVREDKELNVELAPFPCKYCPDST